VPRSLVPRSLDKPARLLVKLVGRTARPAVQSFLPARAKREVVALSTNLVAPRSELHRVIGIRDPIHVLVLHDDEEQDWKALMWGGAVCRAATYKTSAAASLVAERWFSDAFSDHVCGPDCQFFASSSGAWVGPEPVSPVVRSICVAAAALFIMGLVCLYWLW
jgi:hypothetical protein